MSADFAATAWIAEGMTVVVYRWQQGQSHTAEVVRFTNTQIILRAPRGQEIRHRRDTGRQVGDYHGGGELRPVTDPAWLAQEREAKERAAVDKVRDATNALRFKFGREGWAGLLALRATVDEALKAFDEQAGAASTESGGLSGSVVSP